MKFTGKNGAVYFDGVLISGVTKWNASYTVSVIDSTPVYNPYGWTDSITGKKSWSATVNCLTDSGKANILYSALGNDLFKFFLSLQFDGTESRIDGFVFLNDISFEVSVDDVVSHTLSFTGVLGPNGEVPIVY